MHVRPTGEGFVVARDDEAVAGLVERLRPRAPRLVVLEATDGLQAQTLAALVARRRELVALRTAEKNRLQQAQAGFVRRDLETSIGALAERTAAIDEEIERHVKASPIWRAQEDLLKSVPGVGPTVARTLIAELPELGRLSGRKSAALVGVAPLNRDSGTLRGRRSICGGRPAGRATLYMATVTAARCNPTIAAMFQRLRNAGKPAKVALTACMRKLLTILNAIARDRQA